jgi:glycosyltransferase involved in cell wall biosynthesis
MSEFARLVWKHRNEHVRVFALSTTNYLVALALLRKLRADFRIVLGFFHPDTWRVSLEGDVSRTRKRVMERVIPEIPLENIVFSSYAGYRAGNLLLRSPATPIIAPGPILRDAGDYAPPDRPFSIITVGRLVPFKACTVRAMIEVVERLRNEGFEITYTIAGDGPEEAAIRERVKASPFPEAFTVLGPTLGADFARLVGAHHLFFGMGGAVTRAALLGAPSIVAIQRETAALCYGLMSDHDHAAFPVFGDPEEGLARIPLEKLVRDIIALSNNDRVELGRRCQLSAEPYTSENLIARIEDAFERARPVATNVGLLELAAIRAETWGARVRGRRGLDG